MKWGHSRTDRSWNTIIIKDQYDDILRKRDFSSESAEMIYYSFTCKLIDYTCFILSGLIRLLFHNKRETPNAEISEKRKGEDGVILL